MLEAVLRIWLALTFFCLKSGSGSGIFLNTALSFDENYIYCGAYNFTYEDLKQIKEMHGEEDCTLLDETTLHIRDLWDLLLTDFSFFHTEKIGHLL